MTFTWQTHPRPLVVLAPMAGYTDSPFRQICKELAPELITVSELTSADALAYDSKKTLDLIRYTPTERPYIVQLFGKHPDKFAKAVKVVTELGVDGIDINMGCPARKVVGSDHGAALLKTPTLAAEIVQACRENTHLPISVKTRLGWTSPDDILTFAPQIQAAGAHALHIHGRTYAQGFTGLSDWTNIYRVKDMLHIPVLGNGDITSPADYQQKIKNLDGVLVGRATFGNPWLLAQLTGAGDYPSDFTDRLPTILRHVRLSEQTLGRKGMFDIRKHLAAYVRGLPNARELRSRLITIESYAETLQVFSDFFPETIDKPK